MTVEKTGKSAIELCLPQKARQRIEAMMAEASDDFVALVRKAGLDPRKSFRGKVLRVDFGMADLNGFDFSGADLTGCDLSAAKLDGATLTGARRGNGQRFLELNRLGGSVNSVAFSPDGSRIVSGSGGGEYSLLLWDAATGMAMGAPLRGREDWVRSVAFSIDGGRIVSGEYDGALYLWDATTAAALGKPMRGHENRINSVAFSPTGLWIVSGGYDGALRLWDATTGDAQGAPLRGHEGPVNSVAFSPDGSRIVSGGNDRTVRIWDTANGAALGAPLSGHLSRVTSVAFSSDGRTIVSGGKDGKLRLWDAATGKALGEPMEENEYSVCSVAFSHDGSLIVAGGDDGTLRLWNTATCATLGETLYGHDGEVRSVAFSPDGRSIVSGGVNGKVIIWFLDPPVHQMFVTTRPEPQSYTRNLLKKLFAHPEMTKRKVVAATLDPLTNLRPEEGARNALENSVTALFIVGDKDLAFMQHGELELARQLQRKTGQPRNILVFTSSAIPKELPYDVKGYHFVHMPLDKPETLDALVAAICQAIDAPPSLNERGKEAERDKAKQDMRTADSACSGAKRKSRGARVKSKRIDRFN